VTPGSDLDAARLAWWEEPGEALEIAIAAQGRARASGDAVLESRALTLQGSVSMHRGDLRGAFALLAEAERLAADDVVARAEHAALSTHLHFFAGSYTESLKAADDAIALADSAGDLGLALHARRMACLAYGNVGVDDLERRLGETLELALRSRSRWDEAVCRNDLATWHLASDQLDAAGEQLALALAAAETLERNRFVLGLLSATGAEVALARGDPEAGLVRATTALAHLRERDDANPYLLGMAVLVQVRALLALGRTEDARRAGEQTVSRLGDRVPQARSMILSAVAGALREAGRSEEAYDTLARGMALEREALAEFSALRIGLERARLANADLERLNRRLADEAERDFLTGLHNRRYLARARDDLSARPAAVLGQVSLAIGDIDEFKSVNDRFGHHVGDHVLRRIGDLVVEHLRTQDVVARTGGEEFTVLMPATDAAEAAACCERLRGVVEADDWDDVAPGLRVTISFGHASAPAGQDLISLEKVADAALYDAKRAGRNRVSP
jgi:diguanylate cyclase (GGDEF)-like protein